MIKTLWKPYSVCQIILYVQSCVKSFLPSCNNEGNIFSFPALDRCHFAVALGETKWGRNKIGDFICAVCAKLLADGAASKTGSGPVPKSMPTANQRLEGLDCGLEKIQKILTFFDWIWIANPFCWIVGFPHLDWIDQSNPSNFLINYNNVSRCTKIGSYFQFKKPLIILEIATIFECMVGLHLF